MLTPEWFPLRRHDKQSAAYRTRARFVGLHCGRGSGKTMLARRYVVRMLPVRKPHPDPIFFYALPTRTQAKRVAWEKLQALVPPSWIAPRGVSHSDLCIRTVFGSSLWVVGMDEPARVEGSQWDGCVIDESCDQWPGGFARSVRPALSHRNGWCWRIGVPKRFGPGAAEFKEWCDAIERGEYGPSHESYSWPSSDILSPEEIAAAQRELDPKDYAEQYDAAWQGVSGLCHHAFDEVLNVVGDIQYDPKLPIIVGSDFNVDPMCWVLMQHQQWPGWKEKCFVVFDEVFLRNTNTQATLDALHARYGKHQSGWLFFGDAAGQARKTSASTTDYAQIRNDQRFLRAKVLYPKANPRVVDRFAAVNRQFCNAAGERRLFLHPRCKHLKKDLTSRYFKPGTREPADTRDVGHMSDALGYPIHYLRPLGVDPGAAPQVFVSKAG